MNHQDNEDFIDLGEIFSILLSYKKIIFIGLIISGLASIYIAKSSPDIYRSSALLEPQQSNQNQNSFSSIPAGFGGLASLAGVQLPTSSLDRGLYAIEVIKSKVFFKHLLSIDSDRILPSIMAIESYDISNKKIKFDTNIYNDASNKWVREVKANQKVVPSYIEAHEHFLSILEVFKDKKTGYIYIAIDHQSPVFAQYLLNLVILEVNNLTREMEMQETSEAIEYLTKKQLSTKVSSVKLSINNIIESQLQTQMLTNIREEFLLKTIDPPVVPEIKIGPSRLFICVIGVFFGFIFSIFSVLVFHLLRSNYITTQDSADT
ncbi:MAG: hypothetical protein CMQ83_03445 [Gammaproteobacteria bacterium]|nr:hypothetical protein [Gammaproteobacteria bacterium]